MKKMDLRGLAAIAIAALLSGCAGGGSRVATPGLPAGPAAQAQTASPLKVTLRIPAGGANASARQPAYVSPSTNGVAITVYPAIATPPPSPTLVADVSATSPNCTSNPDGSRSCQLSVQAPIGNDFFIVTTYSLSPAGGTPQGVVLSTSTLQFQVRAGQVNTLPLTLNGVVATVVLGPTSFLVPSSAQTLTLNVSAKDAAGNLIVGPGNYNVPITLAVSGDPNATTSLSTTSLTSPATTQVSVNYNGGAISIVTITGSAAGAISGTATLAPNSSSTGVQLGIAAAQPVISEFAAQSPASNPHSIAATADGNVWFTETNANNIGMLNTSTGTVTELQLVVSGAPRDIAVGPDGNLWFTHAGGAGAIGKITPAGTVVEMGGSGCGPFGITAGPDGAMWYAESCNDRIGRIDMAGNITQYPVPATVSQSGPFTVAVGGDGNIWYGKVNDGIIGKMSTAGAVLAEYTLGSAHSPYYLTKGPDGAIWFVDLGPSTGTTNVVAIGRIDAAGNTSYFAPPNPGGSNFVQIALGPDNNLWVTDYASNTIDRMTTAGVYTQYGVPTGGAGPRGLVAGIPGSNALWFTEALGNKIGKVALTSGVWTAKAPMPTARGAFGMDAINGQIYTVDGGPQSGYALTVNEVYNPATNAWTTKASDSLSRGGVAAGAINGKLYVAGGWIQLDANAPTGTLTIYDPATDTWSSGAPMPQALGFSASAVLNGKLYVIGGLAYRTASNQLQIYDPATNTWDTSKPPRPLAAMGAAAGAIGGKIYVAGGGDFSGGHFAQTDVFDPASNTWTTLNPMPVGLANVSGAALNGKLYVTGGNTAAGAVHTLEVFDPATSLWTTAAAVPPLALAGRVGVVTLNGTLYVMGGNPNNVYQGANYAFTP